MLNYNLYGSVFAVPSAITDAYIKLANGSALKVILYILRYNLDVIDNEQLAKTLGLTVENVAEAISFWENLGVLTESVQQLTLMGSMGAESAPADEDEKKEESPLLSNEISKLKPSLTPSDISLKIENSQTLKGIFELAENYFQCKLNSSHCNTLIWLNEDLGFSPEAILMLIDYCFEHGKLQWKYIETVAYDWYKKEIFNIDDIAIEIKRMEEFYAYQSVLRRLFRLPSPLTKFQADIAEKWKIAGYSEEILFRAYEITVENISRPHFKYIDKILVDWAVHNLKTVPEVEEYIKNNPGNNAAKAKTLRKVKEKPCSFDLSRV